MIKTKGLKQRQCRNLTQLPHGTERDRAFWYFGGRFVAETLTLILRLERAYAVAKADLSFQSGNDYYLSPLPAGPSPLYFAERNQKTGRGANLF